jgi:hypothetical protein
MKHVKYETNCKTVVSVHLKEVIKILLGQDINVCVGNVV